MSLHRKANSKYSKKVVSEQSKSNYPAHTVLSFFLWPNRVSKTKVIRDKVTRYFQKAMTEENSESKTHSLLQMYMESRYLRIGEKRDRPEEYTEEYLSAFYAPEQVRELFFYFIELVFCLHCPPDLCDLFGIRCCTLRTHSTECSEKWKSLKLYFYQEMLKKLGLEPLYYYRKGITYEIPQSAE